MPFKHPRQAHPFRTMEVGDVFFLPRRAKNDFAPYACVMGQRLGRKFATRLCYMMEQIDGWVDVAEDHPFAIRGIKVWRVE